ncbi:MAG: hypothetical protein QM757_15245 [Paludibaculum sp.]
MRITTTLEPTSGASLEQAGQIMGATSRIRRAVGNSAILARVNHMRIAWMALASVMTLAAQDAREYSESYQSGRSMSRSAALELEKTLTKHPSDLLARTRLIAFYTLSVEIEPSEAIPSRRKHLLWLAQERPASWLWSQRSYGTAVYREGGRLPDAEGFEQIREVWVKHLAAKSDSKVRENAASFLQLGDRQTALGLIRQMSNPRYLGTTFALTLLGVTARDFDSGEPLEADPSVRESELGKLVTAELDRATDPQLVGGAGVWLSRDGAMLWNRGYREWDYSPLAKSLLIRASGIEPTRLDWFLANPELPKPGEVRGLGQIRVGSAVLSGMAVRLVKPDVSPALAGIKGRVSLEIAVGQDGRVLKAIPTGGPRELYDISVAAVEQWVYKPTTVRGVPVIVLSSVEIKFE